MSIMDFSGKHFLVIGAGISGRAASLALAGHGGSVTLNDMKAIDTAEQPWPDIKAAGVQLVFGSRKRLFWTAWMSSSRRRSFLRKSRS